MQVPQDNFFYHSNARLGADGGLKDERQLLVEEQKLCRVRARKFSLETNRRRKVLEDKRKLLDVREQRLRENILEQRRQRVQDATERFQRAHLPPSQRRRQSFRRNAPTIEEALNQIQGTLSSHTHQSSFLSSNLKIRSCISSPKNPTVSKSSHHQTLSAIEAYTKLLQEQSMTCFNNQETERIQENQQNQQNSPQDSHLSDCCNSESFSSKDSLENEDPSHSTKNLQNSLSSFLLHSEEPHPVLRNQNDLYPTSDLTFSAMMLLDNNLLQSKELHEPKQKKHKDPEGPKNTVCVSKSWGLASEQMPKMVTQPALHNCNLLTFCEIVSADPEYIDTNSPPNNPNDTISVTNRLTPSNTVLESDCPKQEALLDLRQQRVHDDRQLKHPSATEILLPAKNGNNKEILFGSLPKHNIFFNNNTTYNASQDAPLQQSGKENHCVSYQKELAASINNLNKVLNSESKSEKPLSTALLQHTCLSNIQSDTLNGLKCSEEEAQELLVPHASVCKVRFIKGILKKQSKYMSEGTTCLYGSGHLIFSKQVALEIRDSVELTRAKTKDVEANKTVKKKLRWFDEVRVEKEDKEQNIIKLIKSKPSSLSQSKSNSEDHQLSVTTVSGAYKPGPIMTSTASTGYHFTKQAWTDVGVQVSLPQEQENEVKVPRSSTRTGGPKVPCRERSAKVGVGPVSTRTRKGTVIRPQSATEVSQIAKTQGKLMVPRPPPRMEEKMVAITKTPYGMDHATVNCKKAQAVEQVLHKDNSECFLSPYTHHGIRKDSTVMYTLLPTSYTIPAAEVNMKGTPSSGHQETHNCSRRRGMVFSDKGVCLDCTPTDEEISQLWHGVRSALVTKDAKAMLARQALESGRVVRKPFVEHSRHPPGLGNRKLPESSQPAKQTAEPVRQCSSTYDTGFPDEGFHSAAHLHKSEVHAEGLLKERDIVATAETAQKQRPRMVQNHSQKQGLTSISLEEQKIILSLDRLNHQLQCVQEHAGGKTGTRDLVLSDARSTKEVKVTSHHKHRASSANHCTRYQKTNHV
ncbi:Centrosomal protein of 126 kDa [Channa argus]|uniref:Centrosomal protein of 126 kDa n=1 Tax=Channa argus TaxID=215402 RepID=A0A6G1PSG7_CHAAH|nr:Centrosomal protein of 126 kDa [Channa argus]